jgi:hypothetical protein
MSLSSSSSSSSSSSHEPFFRPLFKLDPYDITEPKDILPQLKKEFWEGLESKKWSDRKGQLTVLKDLASYPHLATGR